MVIKPQGCRVSSWLLAPRHTPNGNLEIHIWIPPARACHSEGMCSCGVRRLSGYRSLLGLVHGPSSSSASPLPYIVSPGSSAFPLRLKPRDGVRVPLGDRSVLGLFPVTPKLWGASICSEQERPQLCVWPAPSHTNSSALAEATAGLTLCNSTSCWG